MEAVNTAGAAPEQQPGIIGIEAQPAVKTPDNNQVPPVIAGKQPSEPAPQEILDWKQDKRYGKIWKSENDVYKSYREHEKMHEPIKRELDELKNIFAETKIDPKQLSEIVKELDTLKAPDRPQNALFTALEPFLKDPVYAKEIEAFFDELERKSITAKYPGMTEDQIRKQIDLENRLGQLETEKKQVEFDKQVEAYGKSMGEAWKKIESFTKSRNFVLTDEIKGSFKDYCSSKMIDPELYLGVFQQMFNEELEKSYSSVLEKQILAKLNGNKQTTVPAVGIAGQPAAKTSFRDKLKAAAGIPT